MDILSEGLNIIRTFSVWRLAFVLLDYFFYSCIDNSTITYELDRQGGVKRVLVAWLALSSGKDLTRDTHSETDGPARLPPRLLGDGDTLLEIYSLPVRIKILYTWLIEQPRQDKNLL
jgi:hypothetical protein